MHHHTCLVCCVALSSSCIPLASVLYFPRAAPSPPFDGRTFSTSIIPTMLPLQCSAPCIIPPCFFINSKDRASTSHPFPAFSPPQMHQSSRPSLSPYPLSLSHPPINPPRQPCYHDNRASAKLKSRTWLPWFPLLRLHSRPRAGWEGRGRCSVGACAMRPREGAGEAVGRDLKRRGREKKGIRRGVELASTVAGEGRAGPEAAGW